jgi:hypothetical protein
LNKVKEMNLSVPVDRLKVGGSGWGIFKLAAHLPLVVLKGEILTWT